MHPQAAGDATLVAWTGAREGGGEGGREGGRGGRESIKNGDIHYKFTMCIALGFWYIQLYNFSLSHLYTCTCMNRNQHVFPEYTPYWGTHRETSLYWFLLTEASTHCTHLIGVLTRETSLYILVPLNSS